MRILLVEDDKFFRKFYVEKLKEKGFEIGEADDGVQGLEKMKSFKPDLVVLDIIMPNKDGFELLSEVQNDIVLKKIPILVFSTLGQEADIDKAKKLGAVDYVNKSLFDFNDLIVKINTLTKK
ncbi:response regulator [Candidatus Roizmanbacteria bacterium]|nr:response regulator [Candidatus Roizmanbacteria bacterium]